MIEFFKFIRNESIVHFMVLAIILFVFDYLSSRSQKESIHVSNETINYLVKQQEEYRSRKLTAPERKEIIDKYVSDEILYREAYNLGLDKNSRMRENLLRIMHGLEDSKIGEPTQKDLKQYFESNRELYKRAPSYSLEHIFFQKAALVPENLLEQLGSGLNPRSIGDKLVGADFLINNAMQIQLVYFFGPDSANKILELDVGNWHGPYTSSRGLHFVKVIERQAATLQKYEEVAHLLKFDWKRDRIQLAIKEKTTKLRDKYDIKVERSGSDQ
jgi:hypothetical protein